MEINLVIDKISQENLIDLVPIILAFNIQYKKIEKIIKRH